jgi:hypothetical protein
MGVMYKGVAGLPTFGALGEPPRLYVAPPVVMYGEWGTELPIIFRNLLVQSDYTVWIDSYPNCLMGTVNVEQLISNTQ